MSQELYVQSNTNYLRPHVHLDCVILPKNEAYNALLTYHLPYSLTEPALFSQMWVQMSKSRFDMKLYCSGSLTFNDHNTNTESSCDPKYSFWWKHVITGFHEYTLYNKESL